MPEEAHMILADTQMSLESGVIWQRAGCQRRRNFSGVDEQAGH
jgi:hypothetical protein